MKALTIPAQLRPSDGRFGSGPAKIRPESLAKLATRGDLMGTSHRAAPVKSLVSSIQAMLTKLYSLPDGYRVVLGTGGATLFWDLAVSSLIEHQSAHSIFGEFGRKFANAAAAAPFLDAPRITEAPLGSSITPPAAEDVDTYAWPHNETSTGAWAPAVRPQGASSDSLVLIDATSAAGGMALDVTQTDAYYFAPQKNFSSDGALWVSLCSPKLFDRAERIAASGRWIPASLNFNLAAEQSAKNQTLNTPAIATLLLLADQLRWMLDHGGLDFTIARTTESAKHLYTWAENHELATPFVADPAHRSPLVGTINFAAEVDAKTLCAVLRANGIVDLEPYRNAGGNQIRVAMYASVEPDDVRALTACIDWVLERL